MMLRRPTFRAPVALLLLCGCLVDFSAVAASFKTNVPATTSSVVSGKKVVVVGGGPVGLYFAALMLHRDPTVKIEILEKQRTSSVNAFGMGVGHRMQHWLEDVPDLKEKAISISAQIDSLGIPLVSRDDLTEQMSEFLLDKYGSQSNFRLCVGEECVSVDLEHRQITTSSGRTISYDLLLGADGVNSKIRRRMAEALGIKEEHYIQGSRWKALKLPKQPDVVTGSFQPLRHPSISGGRVLPKAPEGHILLMFWQDTGLNNPTGIKTTEDLKRMISEAMQVKRSGLKNLVRNLLGLEMSESVKKDRTVVFDETALEEFIASRPGRSHHLKIDQYHYQDSVALIGDSAHSFNSMLGQGCATGFESTHKLVDALMSSQSLSEALANYTQSATHEAHAMTELSLISYIARPGFSLLTLKALPLILWNAMRGKGLLKRIVDINVPYSTVAAENKRLLIMAQPQFEKERLPYEER